MFLLDLCKACIFKLLWCRRSFFSQFTDFVFFVSKGQKRGKTSFIVKIVVCSEECPAVICGKGAPEQIFVGIKRCNLAKLVEIFVSGVFVFCSLFKYVQYHGLQCCLQLPYNFSYSSIVRTSIDITVDVMINC